MIRYISPYSFCNILLACLIVSCFFGCGKDKFDREFWIERGQTALKPFKQELMSALADGLQDGPEAAIDVCQRVAPEIADEINSPEVRVGRTSHKLRNEHNSPKAWMQPLLNGYLLSPGKSNPEAVRLADGRIGYVEPIYVKSMCLACHGSNLSPTIAARIDELYPNDRARDFQEGDFRGLFWVEFSPDKMD